MDTETQPLASDHHHQQVDAETISENQSHPSTHEDDDKEKLKPDINVVSETSPVKEEGKPQDKTEEPSVSVETEPRQVEETVAEPEAISGSDRALNSIRLVEQGGDKTIEAEPEIKVCESALEKEEVTTEKPASTIPADAAGGSVEEKEPAKELEEVAPGRPAESDKPASTEPAEASDEKIPSVETWTEKTVPTVANDIKEKQEEVGTVESLAEEKPESVEASGSVEEKELSVEPANESKEVAPGQPAETQKPTEITAVDNVSEETPAPAEAVKSVEDKKLPAESPALEVSTVETAESEEKAKEGEAAETMQVGNPEHVELLESAEPKNPSPESSITTEATGIAEKQTESDAAENVAQEKLASAEVAECTEKKPPVEILTADTAPVETAKSEDKTLNAEAVKVVSEEKPASAETVEPVPDQAVTVVAESVLKEDEKSTKTSEAAPEQKPEPSKVEKEAPSEKQLPIDQTAVGAVSQAPENAQEEKPKVEVEEKLEPEAVEVTEVSKEVRMESISNEAESKGGAESVGQVEETAECFKPDTTKGSEVVSETSVVEAAKDTVSQVSVNAAKDVQEAKTENLEEKAEAKIEKTEEESNIQSRDVEVIKKEDGGKVPNSKTEEVAVESKKSQPVDSKDVAAQPPSANETKKGNETKQAEQQTVQEVLVKSSKSSGNIMSKVKQSIVKVKKAITGKSPSSKTEAKVDQTIGK